MTVQELLDLLNQQGGGASSGSASVSPASIGASPAGSIGSELGGLASTLAGGDPGSGDASLGGGLGGLAGLALMPILGPLGPLLGAFGGDFIGSLFGGGVPREAKTASIGQALSASTNPLDAALAPWFNNQVNAGRVLSSSGSGALGPEAAGIANMLEALTGQSFSPVTGTGNFQNNPTFTAGRLGNIASHMQLPQGYQFLDPSSLTPNVVQDVIRAVTAGGSPQHDWQKVVNELIANGSLQKYRGALGPVGAGNTSSGAIPNVSLPRPLAPNPANQVQSPYPV